MQSEGPYQFIGGIVEGPDGSYKITSDDKYIQAIKAQAYAEGRKAAEKDFKEFLEMANQLRTGITADKFDAWKKARGII